MVLGTENKPVQFFILGPAYHGAGTLAWRLNHHFDIFSLGTANPARGKGQLCSCGEPVENCPFWKIAEKALAFDEGEEVEFDTFLPPAPQITKRRNVNNWLNGIIAAMAQEATPKAWKMVYEQAERYLTLHNRFRDAIRDWTPHRAFVDAERSTVKFMVMASMGFPVRGVIHLVRDPRSYVAVMKKFYPESAVEKTTLEWASAHERIRRLESLFPSIPFMTVRYEDMAEDPDGTFDKVVDFMDQKLAVREELTIGSSKNHMVGLSPQETEGGFNKKPGYGPEILSPEEQERVLKVAGPLFKEFGYKPENIT